MESTDDNDVIIYAFLDENKTALSTNDEKCPQQEDFLTLFKVKVSYFSMQQFWWDLLFIYCECHMFSRW